MISFIVTMYKYGQRDNFSYVLGAWETFEVAEHNADFEMLYRGPGMSSAGYKYEYEIIKFDTDVYRFESLINTNPEDRPDYMGEVVAELPKNIFDKNEAAK